METPKIYVARGIFRIIKISILKWGLESRLISGIHHHRVRNLQQHRERALLDYQRRQVYRRRNMVGHGFRRFNGGLGPVVG